MTTEPGYVHGHHESVLRSHRRRTAANSAAHLVPHLRPGQSLLDVGSGPGTITADLARLVAPGPVTALEVSDAALAITRAGLHERDVTFLVGDVHALDLPDSSFDVVHAHQVLQHLSDPVQALREMRRVCRPGGLVAVRDADYAGFAWWPRLPGLDSWLDLYRRAARQAGGEPDAGRRLLGWAQAAGFRDVVATSSTWCYATPEDRAEWGGMWADRIVQSDVADRLLGAGMATDGDLRAVSAAWRAWAAADDGWLSVLHGELLCRTPV